MTIDIEYGTETGSACLRNGCIGIIAEMESEGCSCHIDPPCSECTTPKEWCPECVWRLRDDERMNGYVVNVDRSTGVYRLWTPRPLDSTKIDWRTESHTNSSQCCVGVYPDGTERAEVEKRVRGTFGGRFEYFDSGKFRYIAYTD